MVKGRIGAAGMGFVGAAPLFEPVPLLGNWAYADVPGMEPLLDQGEITHNIPTSFAYSGNWAYAEEPTTQPLLDQGGLTHNRPTSRARGHNQEPFNASARGLSTRADKKIKRPWLWP